MKVLMTQLPKNNVYANYIGIETIDSGRVYDVGNKTAKMPISPPADMVGRKPPDIAEQMRPRGMNIRCQKIFLMSTPSTRSLYRWISYASPRRSNCSAT